MHRRRHSPVPASIRLPRRWRRYGLTPWLAALLAVALVCVRSAERRPVATDDQSRYHDRMFRVTRVVDGDTLDIDEPDDDKRVTRVRLWGVDTPEIGHGRQAGMYFGPEATAFAQQTLSERTVQIVLSPKRSRDKYGRLLAYVFLERGGPMFNELLLERGLAYADPRFPHHYADRFEAIDKRARKDGVGLWKDLTLDKMPAWKQRVERRGD